jgi:hypothetical protein
LQYKHKTAQNKSICSGEQQVCKKQLEVAQADKFMHSPNYFEQTQFQTVTAFHSHTEVWEHEKRGVFAAVFRVFEMVQ